MWTLAWEDGENTKTLSVFRENKRLCDVWGVCVMCVCDVCVTCV